jgi:hypothetical protein
VEQAPLIALLQPCKGGAFEKNRPQNNNNNRSQQGSNLTLTSPNTALGFSQAELFELQDSFKLFDIDNAGLIQVGDFQSILKTLQEDEQQQNGWQSENVPPLGHALAATSRQLQ